MTSLARRPGDSHAGDACFTDDDCFLYHCNCDLPAGGASRRRDCHFADAPSLSLLMRLLQGERVCSRMAVSPRRLGDAEDDDSVIWKVVKSIVFVALGLL